MSPRPTHESLEFVGLDLEEFKKHCRFTVSKDGTRVIGVCKVPGGHLRADVDLGQAYDAVVSKLQGRTGWDFDEIEDASHRIALRVGRDRAARALAADAIAGGFFSDLWGKAKGTYQAIAKGAKKAAPYVDKVAQHPATAVALTAFGIPPQYVAQGQQAMKTITDALRGDEEAKDTIHATVTMAAQGVPAAKKAQKIFQNVWGMGKNKGTWWPFGGPPPGYGYGMPQSLRHPFRFNWPGMPQMPAMPALPPMPTPSPFAFAPRGPAILPHGFPFPPRGTLGPSIQPPPFGMPQMGPYTPYGTAQPADWRAGLPISPFMFPGGRGAQAAWLSGHHIPRSEAGFAVLGAVPKRGWLLNVPFRSPLEARAIDPKNPFHILRGGYTRGRVEFAEEKTRREAGESKRF